MFDQSGMENTFDLLSEISLHKHNLCVLPRLVKHSLVLIIIYYTAFNTFPFFYYHHLKSSITCNTLYMEWLFSVCLTACWTHGWYWPALGKWSCYLWEFKRIKIIKKWLLSLLNYRFPTQHGKPRILAVTFPGLEMPGIYSKSGKTWNFN